MAAFLHESPQWSELCLADAIQAPQQPPQWGEEQIVRCPTRRRFRRPSNTNSQITTRPTYDADRAELQHYGTAAVRREGNVTVPWHSAGPVHTTPRGPTLEEPRNEGTTAVPNY